MVKTRTIIQHGIDQRLHIGAQLFVSLGDRIVLDEAFGSARAGVPMTRDTSMIWLSAGKPVTAVAVLRAMERGQLHLDDPLAKHWPAFAEHGKDAVTVRHALTHTGGFRGVSSRMDALPFEQAIDLICQQRLEPAWTPGEKAGYHIASSWYLLAAILGGGDPLAFSQLLQRDVFAPAGMVDCFCGMAADVYDSLGDRLGVMHQTDGGTVRPHPSLDSRDATITPRPGSNVRGPIRQLGRFYQALLNGQLLQPARLTEMIRPQRRGLFDQTFRLTIDWGLGVIVNTSGADMQRFSYGFGPHASPQAFGHGGNQSSIGFADPRHGLVVAAVFNGMPGDAAHAGRARTFLAAVYEDLGVARASSP